MLTQDTAGYAICTGQRITAKLPGLEPTGGLVQRVYTDGRGRACVDFEELLTCNARTVLAEYVTVRQGVDDVEGDPTERLKQHRNLKQAWLPDMLPKRRRGMRV